MLDSKEADGFKITLAFDPFVDSVKDLFANDASAPEAS